MGDTSTTACGPHPPRYWWLKRIALISAAWLVLVVGIRVVWGYYAQRKFDAAIAEIHARGEPVLPEDFNNRPKVPDAENAALVYRQAAAALTAGKAASEVGTVRAELPLTDDELALLRVLQPKTQAARNLYRQARSLPGYDSGIVMKSPIMGMLLPGLSDNIWLGKACRDEALLKSAEGDYAGALACVRDMLVHGRHAAGTPLLIAVLVSTSVGGMGAGQAGLVAAYWQPTPGDATAEGRAAANVAFRAEAQAVVALLLDDGYLASNMAQAMCGERAAYVDAVKTTLGRTVPIGSLSGGSYGSGPAPAGPGEWLSLTMLDPVLRDGACASMHIYDRYVDAAKSLTVPPAGSLDSSLSSGRYSGVRYMLVRLLMPSVNSALKRTRRLIAERRAAAAALAVRLYELDHGTRPAKLEQLVPAYLPAVPTDPCSPTSEPLHYRADGTQPAVWSVGDNGQDDGGVFARIAQSMYSTAAVDVVMPLTPGGLGPRLPDANYDASLKQALDEQLNKGNAGGQDNEAQEGQD